MNAGYPGKRINVQLLRHAFHSFPDHLAESCLSFLLIGAELLEIPFFKADGEMKQVIFLWLAIRIEETVSSAISQSLAILAEQRPRSRPFALEVLITLGNVTLLAPAPPPVEIM
jgi:hypothetical protein